MRLDLFLKVSRLIKRRTLAKEYCEKGLVRVNGEVGKPGKKVKEGDIIELETPEGYRKVEILKIPSGNVSKKEASSLYRILEERRWLE